MKTFIIVALAATLLAPIVASARNQPATLQNVGICRVYHARPIAVRQGETEPDIEIKTAPGGNVVDQTPGAGVEVDIKAIVTFKGERWVSVSYPSANGSNITGWVQDKYVRCGLHGQSISLGASHPGAKLCRLPACVAQCRAKTF
jgi:hypothetical protein